LRTERGVPFRCASPGACVLAVAFPIVLVHVDFQPGWDTTVGSTHAHIVLSDLAVLACLVAAVAAAALAEAGRFPEAVAAAERAMARAESQQATNVVQRNRELLELYRAGKPFHQAAPSP